MHIRNHGWDEYNLLRPQPARKHRNRHEYMTASGDLECCLLNYVPNMPLSYKSVSIAAILIDSGDPKNEGCTMICAADWQRRVRALDSDAHLEMLDASLAEMKERLRSPSEGANLFRRIKDSFSNTVRVSQSRKCRGASSPEAMESFANKFLDETSKISPNLSEMQVLQGR